MRNLQNYIDKHPDSFTKEEVAEFKSEVDKYFNDPEYGKKEFEDIDSEKDVFSFAKKK